mmetsp:Transcript_37584/g.66981  ORF Transcript_37584/g.66981 Transcript_37584/m.66981 type:complete len:238 (-) Transcript_37584:322-1035(-)
MVPSDPQRHRPHTIDGGGGEQGSEGPLHAHKRYKLWGRCGPHTAGHGLPEGATVPEVERQVVGRRGGGVGREWGKHELLRVGVGGQASGPRRRGPPPVLQLPREGLAPIPPGDGGRQADGVGGGQGLGQRQRSTAHGHRKAHYWRLGECDVEQVVSRCVAALEGLSEGQGQAPPGPDGAGAEGWQAQGGGLEVGGLERWDWRAEGSQGQARRRVDAHGCLGIPLAHTPLERAGGGSG